MSRPRVLIVDDDPDVAQRLAASLPHAEFDVEVSKLPAEALVRAAALPPPRSRRRSRSSTSTCRE